MRGNRAKRWMVVLLAAACLAAAGCGGGRDRHQDAPDGSATSTRAALHERASAATAVDDQPGAPTATTRRADAPGRLAAALPAGCRADLQRIQQAHARATGTASRTLSQRRAARTSLARLQRQLAADERRVDRLERAYKTASRPLRGFLDAHPDRTLPADQFARYQQLVAAADGARTPYDAAVRTHNALVARHNTVVATYNRLTAAANRLARAASTRQDRFRRLAARCLPRVADWDAAAAPLEQALAAPSTAGAPDAPAADVRCDSPDVWDDVERREPSTGPFERAGYVREGDTLIHLGPRACLALDVLLRDPSPHLACVPRELRERFAVCAPDRAEAAVALTTLAHEAQHVAGVAEEARAECSAIQTVDDVARALGLPRATAAALGRFTRQRVSLPPSYRSPECRRGGAMDLEPGTPAFP